MICGRAFQKVQKTETPRAITETIMAIGIAKGKETEFVSMLQEKNKKMTKSDLSEKAKECDEAEKRIAVLDRIIQNLY